MKKQLKNIEISKGIYWVGYHDEISGLQCNPYLIIDEGEGVLIDPGSVLDFEQVLSNVTELIPLENIKYIILNHQDPDFCSSVPLFEGKGIKVKIATHWRTATIVKYYGITSPYYMVNENGNKLVLSSGRTIYFVPTPYLHFPGAIVTYDPVSKILFSSDLFGAFSYNWSLFADDNYIEGMKTFHEHYMPGNEILRPVMESLLKMDISIIASQHGSIIDKDIKKYIETLRDLQCGIFLHPIKKELYKTGGYISVCNDILKRCYSTYGVSEIKGLFGETGIVFDETTNLIKDFTFAGEDLWNTIFEIIYMEKGVNFLSIIEPLAKKMCIEYDIALPQIFSSTIIEEEMKTFGLSNENKKLSEENEMLKNDLQEIQDKVTKCPITGLYNEQFFLNYLNLVFEKAENGVLLLISLDNISRINFTYGSETGNESLKNLKYVLMNLKEESHQLFKLQGASIAYYLPNTNKKEALNIAENIRITIEKSEIFIEETTVSIGLLSFKEAKDEIGGTEGPSVAIYNAALLRLKNAKNNGMNRISSEVVIAQDDLKKVLVADSDEMNTSILKRALQNEKYKVFVATDGETALTILEKENIDVAIVELMLPKLDGFLIKEMLSANSDKMNMPYIIMSYQKDELTVQRAMSLKIDHFFKKPYMLSEIIGTVKNKINKEEG